MMRFDTPDGHLEVGSGHPDLTNYLFLQIKAYLYPAKLIHLHIAWLILSSFDKDHIDHRLKYL